MTISPEPNTDRIQELEAKVTELTALVERLAPAAMPNAISVASADAEAPATSSRRGMLKLAGAAAVGAVGAAVASSLPAAADNGIVATDPAVQTTLNYTGVSATGNAFLFQAGTTFLNSTSVFPAALAGWTFTSPNQKTGVYGFSFSDNGHGVVGVNDKATGIGVRAESSSGIGVRGRSTSGTGVVAASTTGTALTADGATGINVHGVANGVVATASGATSFGVMGSGGGAGVAGLSGEYSVGAYLSTKANLFLKPNNSFIGTSLKTVPAARVDAHLVGEMDNVDGDLWFCVVAGTPGVWKKITGPATAGSFHAITPTRVYDSRSAAPAPGVLASGANRLVSVADGRDLTSGLPTAVNLVPVGATAITANVTVANTTGAGFLAVNPGGNITVGAATINWSATGQILNNGVSLTLNATRQVTVIAGGGGSTDFVIDVSGFYL